VYGKGLIKQMVIVAFYMSEHSVSDSVGVPLVGTLFYEILYIIKIKATTDALPLY